MKCTVTIFFQKRARFLLAFLLAWGRPGLVVVQPKAKRGVASGGPGRGGAAQAVAARRGTARARHTTHRGRGGSNAGTSPGTHTHTCTLQCGLVVTGFFTSCVCCRRHTPARLFCSLFSSARVPAFHSRGYTSQLRDSTQQRCIEVQAPLATAVHFLVVNTHAECAALLVRILPLKPPHSNCDLVFVEADAVDLMQERDFVGALSASRQLQIGGSPEQRP